jgi:hypothetical protein
VRVSTSCTSVQIELHRAIAKAAFEREDVAATQASRHHEGERRAGDRGSEDGGELAGERQRLRQPHDTRAGSVAKLVEPDVDDGLGRAFVGGPDWCVEDFVAGTENRATEHRLAASGRESAGRPGNSSAPIPPNITAADGVAVATVSPIFRESDGSRTPGRRM